jgi:hypothetical protein
MRTENISSIFLLSSMNQLNMKVCLVLRIAKLQQHICDANVYV